MPKSRKIGSFYLVVTDADQKVFTVVGPMTDDSSWNKCVCDAQDAGRKVNCFTPGPGQSKDEIIAGVRKQLRFEYAEQSPV